VKTILVPVDFSPATAAVVAEGVALARALQGRVRLFTAVQPPVVMAEYAALLSNIAEISVPAEKALVRKLGQLEAKVAADFIAVDSDHGFGAPIPLILEQAKACAADYIVMGSHGHTALYDLIVGSTTHGVLKRAKCPVVIVPAAQSTPAKPKRRKK
jgi:nucleotide-binding universal stress UspA family protein